MKLLLERLKNKKGQGTTEYIVIVAVIVGLLFVLMPRIKDAIKAKTGELTAMIGGTR